MHSDPTGFEDGSETQRFLKAAGLSSMRDLDSEEAVRVWLWLPLSDPNGVGEVLEACFRDETFCAEFILQLRHLLTLLIDNCCHGEGAGDARAKYLTLFRERLG